MSDQDTLETRADVYRFLCERGFKISKQTVYNQVAPGGVFAPPSTGKNKGKFLTARILSAAMAKYGHKLEGADAGPNLPDATNAGEARSLADAKLKEVQAARAQHRHAVELGRYVETRVIESELASRGRAFALGLEKFLPEQAEKVAQGFGGGHEAAAELAAALCLGQDAVPVIIDFALSRLPKLRAQWAADVERMLDAYATGAWWTEEMRAAWERFEANAADAAPDVQGAEGAAE